MNNYADQYELEWCTNVVYVSKPWKVLCWTPNYTLHQTICPSGLTQCKSCVDYGTSSIVLLLNIIFFAIKTPGPDGRNIDKHHHQINWRVGATHKAAFMLEHRLSTNLYGTPLGCFITLRQLLKLVLQVLKSEIPRKFIANTVNYGDPHPQYFTLQFFSSSIVPEAGRGHFEYVWKKKHDFLNPSWEKSLQIILYLTNLGRSNLLAWD